MFRYIDDYWDWQLDLSARAIPGPDLGAINCVPGSDDAFLVAMWDHGEIRVVDGSVSNIDNATAALQCTADARVAEASGMSDQFVFLGNRPGEMWTDPSCAGSECEPIHDIYLATSQPLIQYE